MDIKTIRDLDIRGRIVFMRLDFNVPVSGSGDQRVVEDDTRIREALPTIKYAIDQTAKVVIGSHFGRPDGKRNPEFSMEPIANRLAELLESEVTLADDCTGEGIEMMARSLPSGGVLLLENLRFHAGEEKNDPVFVNRLSRVADIYINDAFGTSHRMHASTYGLPLIMPVRGMGLLIEKELQHLDPLVIHPAKPFVAVLGGSKVSDKIKTIEFLMTNIDTLLIGGAMAHAFWVSMGRKLPEAA
ncbi:MAG: phosphoglycerate kinase, partial [Bdellovibrionota bacterium]